MGLGASGAAAAHGPLATQGCDLREPVEMLPCQPWPAFERMPGWDQLLGRVVVVVVVDGTNQQQTSQDQKRLC